MKVVLGVFVVLLCGCGLTRSQQTPLQYPPNNNNYPNPDNNYSSPPTLSISTKTHAAFVIDSVEKSFDEEQVTECRFEKQNNRYFLGVNFENRLRATQLIFKVNDLTSTRGETQWDGDKDVTNNSVVLVVDSRKSSSKYDNDAGKGSSICKLRYEQRDNILLGEFQCRNLVNGAGSRVNAKGEFACRIQQSDDWDL